MTLARLARAFLSLPITCPACGESTRHGHYVKPGPSVRGYWACSTFLTRRNLTQNTTEPGGSSLDETSAAGLRGGGV